MVVVKIESQREVFILGCKDRLSPEKIQKVAEEQELKDYSLEEFKVYSAMSKNLIFRNYKYKLAY